LGVENCILINTFPENHSINNAKAVLGANACNVLNIDIHALEGSGQMRFLGYQNSSSSLACNAVQARTKG
jgi:hypothetical protein